MSAGDALETGLERALRAAAESGTDLLAENAALELARGLGLEVPRRLEVALDASAESIDLERFEGDRLVVKIVSATVAHKSDLGGVVFCPPTVAGLEGAFHAIRERVPPEIALDGFSISEFVEHDAALGGELLLGVRWSDDFGPVAVLGLGGLEVERLAADGAFAPVLLTTVGRFPSSGLLPRSHPLVRFLTEPYRGRAPRFAIEDLEPVVERMLAFADRSMLSALAAGTSPKSTSTVRLTEFEFNPVVATPRGLCALDAVARLSRDATDIAPPRPLGKLANLLAPASIAIAGVSRRRNIGRIILENILRQGFPADRLWVVKPGAADSAAAAAPDSGTTIEGCRCYPDFQSLPEPADLAVLSVAAAQMPDLVAEIVDNELAQSLILIPGGLGEREGSQNQARRIEAVIGRSRSASGGGPVVNGGNCLGVRSLPGRYDTLFIPGHKLEFPSTAPSPLALLSQSGAFAVARASKLAALNPTYVVTFGNQIDLTIADYLEHLASDSSVAVFACYLEGFRPLDGRRFLEATANITASGRSVVLYRAGRTAAGARAAASHTASVAGSYQITAELARQAGALVADSIEDFEDLVRTFTLLDGRRPRGRRLGAVSNAGFESVAIGDNLGRLKLATFTEPTRSRLDDLLREHGLDAIVGARNPLDVTPVLADDGFAAAAQAVLEDPEVDLGAIGCVPLTGALQTLPAGPGHGEDLGLPNAVGARLIELWRSGAKPWVAVVDGGRLYDPLADLLAQAGIPTFRAMDRALRALDRWSEFQLAPRRLP